MENKECHVFLELLRAGLWEQETRISFLGKIDFSSVYDLAEVQSVVGLVAAGLEYAKGHNVSQDNMLQIIGQALQIEQRNDAMDNFIGGIVEKMRGADIYTLLIKGQGVAQCYLRPSWRSAGDVDFLLSRDNYQKAAKFLRQFASSVDEENSYTQHLAMSIDNWEVELHGTMRTDLWKRIDKVLDEVQNELFYCGSVRSWMVGKTHVFLPRADEDVVYVFAHILQHFFKEGVGLRQICDWCRLLWTFRDTIDIKLLESRVREMDAMSEWKAFAYFAVNYLGMPVKAMPFYVESSKWHRKADKILSYILETGNFGHKRDMTFVQETSIIERKWKMFCHITKDSARQFLIFPLDSTRVWCHMMGIGLRVLIKGK